MATVQKEPLASVDQLKKIVGEFRRKERTALSNYIPDPDKQRKLVESGRAVVYSFDSSVFILFDTGIMLETIFVSRKRDDIMECLCYIQADSDKPVVVEHVFREGKDLQIGTPNCVLRRMSRTVGVEEPKTPSALVGKAMAEDIPGILDIFRNYFDPFTERIPDDEELERLIRKGGISVIREGRQIVGMVVYEKSAASIHLRYWWVSPSHRNKGVGADLLGEYFCAGRECRRQFLWVFSDNTNAIEKYKHYGFEFDGTADEIYVIK